jgi:hypothetical protein
MDDEQSWRLKVALSGGRERGLLDRLLDRVREPDVVRDAGAELGHDVAITHDGELLFAYAATRPAAETARRAIEAALREDGYAGEIVLSHWDESFDEWLQVDPPLQGEAARREQAAERDMEGIESRTLVISSGKMVRAEVDQTMREWAQKLGLRCEVIEHPHLLSTQVAFTVTGPRRKLDEFAEGLRAEELATMRSEREVMLSPL